MRAFTTVARDRGVTTIPVELRDTADIKPNTELTWVEIEPHLWLVGPESRHPEHVAPVVASALLAEQSPFPKLMRRLVSGQIPQRTGRGYRRPGRSIQPERLTEEQMQALGAPAEEPRRRRGSR